MVGHGAQGFYITPHRLWRKGAEGIRITVADGEMDGSVRQIRLPLRCVAQRLGREGEPRLFQSISQQGIGKDSPLAWLVLRMSLPPGRGQEGQHFCLVFEWGVRCAMDNHIDSIPHQAGLIKPALKKGKEKATNSLRFMVNYYSYGILARNVSRRSHKHHKNGGVFPYEKSVGTGR